MEKEYRRYKRGGFFLACLTAAASCLGVLSSGGASLAQTTGTTTPQVAGGFNHTLSLKSDGTVWAWGLNGDGQLGNGTNTTRYPTGISTPVQVSGLSNVTAMAGGYTHSLAMKSDSTVWAWGDNAYGQLGNGPIADSSTPKQVVLKTTSNNVTYSGTCTAVAAGGYHNLALDKNGRVYAWGNNSYGQLGNNTKVSATRPTISFGTTGYGREYTAVAAGYFHSLALMKDGTVWACGYNKNGQLGDGSITDRSTAVQVTNLNNKVTAVAAGGSHSLALMKDGTVCAWGSNGNGQLGNSSTTDSITPVQVNNLSDVTAVAAGYAHSLALKSDGTLWAWGRNGYGQLGDDTTTDSTIPVQVGGLSSFTSVAAGGYNSLALESDGTLWAKGSNWYGQLGDGATWENAISFALHESVNGTALRGRRLTIEYTSTDANVKGNISKSTNDCPYEMIKWDPGTYEFTAKVLASGKLSGWKGTKTLTVEKGSLYMITFEMTKIN